MHVLSGRMFLTFNFSRLVYTVCRLNLHLGASQYDNIFPVLASKDLNFKGTSLAQGHLDGGADWGAGSYLCVSPISLWSRVFWPPTSSAISVHKDLYAVAKISILIKLALLEWQTRYIDPEEKKTPLSIGQLVMFHWIRCFFNIWTLGQAAEVIWNLLSAYLLNY